MPGKIRAVIVDDEPLAREGIRTMLESEPAIRVVAECRDGVEAIHFFEHRTADILFIDIQMPEVNGFEVLESITPPPIIIFVTAYDKYAVDAFAIHAFDYLLKPIDPERFSSAMQRAITTLQHNRNQVANEQLEALLSAMRTHEGRPERIMVRTSGRIHFLNASEIDWIEAAGDYVYLHVNKKKLLHRERLQVLEARLAPGTFRRIHRSTIVNAGAVRELQPLPHGEGILLLRDGTRLKVSRTYRKLFLASLS